MHKKHHITFKIVLKEAKKEIMIGISKRQQTKQKNMALNKQTSCKVLFIR